MVITLARLQKLIEDKPASVFARQSTALTNLSL